MVYVFCAFYGECSDLIKHYNLKKRQSDKHYRFDVFENDVSSVKIIITGQGAVLVERRSGVERQQQREPVGQGGAGLNITFL